MGFKDRIGEWTRKARERATDAAIDKAKLGAKGAVQGASKLLGDLVFGQGEGDSAARAPLSDKERAEARAKWEDAKARIEQREREGAVGDGAKTEK